MVRFGYHLVEEFVGALHLLVEFLHGEFELVGLLLLLVERQFQFDRLLRAGHHQIATKVVHRQVVDVETGGDHGVQVGHQRRAQKDDHGPLVHVEHLTLQLDRRRRRLVVVQHVALVRLQFEDVVGPFQYLRQPLPSVLNSLQRKTEPFYFLKKCSAAADWLLDGLQRISSAVVFFFFLFPCRCSLIGYSRITSQSGVHFHRSDSSRFAAKGPATNQRSFFFVFFYRELFQEMSLPPFILSFFLPNNSRFFFTNRNTGLGKKIKENNEATSDRVEGELDERPRDVEDAADFLADGVRQNVRQRIAYRLDDLRFNERNSYCRAWNRFFFTRRLAAWFVF